MAADPKAPVPPDSPHIANLKFLLAEKVAKSARIETWADEPGFDKRAAKSRNDAAIRELQAAIKEATK